MDDSDFSDLPALLDQYAERCISPEVDEYHPILLAELKKRVRQARMVLQIAIQWHNQVIALRPHITRATSYEGADPPQVILEMSNATEALEMYTEAFYFVAWRLHQVANMLPHLHKFKSPGVLIVRNHLIQHPERHGRKGIWAFMVSGTGGPVLARMRQTADSTLDMGLWHNAQELSRNLRHALATAITQCASPPTRHTGA